MSAPAVAVAALAVLGCLPWILGFVMNVKLARAMRALGHPPPPARWPRLSIVVPACNEAAHVEAAARTWLAQDYPDLEIILINDRSTDGTGEIFDRLAKEDPRVRAVHVATLPEGWLGKVHALHEGTRTATGELLLFTDADVRLSPTTLRRAVALMELDGLTHLTLIGDLQSRSMLASLCIATALRGIAMSQRPWRHADPRAKEAVGSGAFNLVRRDAFQRTAGFEWLRLEVADDLGLALLMKNAGGKVDLRGAHNDVVVPWYGSFREVERGMEKNAFAQLARYRVSRALLLSSFFVLMALSPLLTLLPLGVSWLWLVGALAVVANAGSALLVWRALGFSPLTVFLSAFVGDVLIAYVIVRAALVSWRRGGLQWRGTVYPTDMLRAGVRVSF